MKPTYKLQTIIRGFELECLIIRFFSFIRVKGGVQPSTRCPFWVLKKFHIICLWFVDRVINGLVQNRVVFEKPKKIHQSISNA